MLYFVVIFVFCTVPCTGLHLLYLSFLVCGKLIIITYCKSALGLLVPLHIRTLQIHYVVIGGHKRSQKSSAYMSELSCCIKLLRLNNY